MTYNTFFKKGKITACLYANESDPAEGATLMMGERGERMRAVSLASQEEQECCTQVLVAFSRSMARQETREPELGCRQVESS